MIHGTKSFLLEKVIYNKQINKTNNYNYNWHMLACVLALQENARSPQNCRDSDGQKLLRHNSSFPGKNWGSFDERPQLVILSICYNIHQFGKTESISDMVATFPISIIASEYRQMENDTSNILKLYFQKIPVVRSSWEKFPFCYFLGPARSYSSKTKC